MAEVKPNFGEAKVQTETFDDSSSLGSNNGILIKKSANSFDLNKLKNKKRLLVLHQNLEPLIQSSQSFTYHDE